MKGIDYIILIILIMIIVWAIKPSLAHIIGKGACCGGQVTVKNRKRFFQKPVKTLTIEIKGMHCTDCAKRIENHLNALSDVTAKVSFNKKEAVVCLYRPIAENQIVQTITEAGYQAEKID